VDWAPAASNEVPVTVQREHEEAKDRFQGVHDILLGCSDLSARHEQHSEEHREEEKPLVGRL
jgi:hypothetical protein